MDEEIKEVGEMAIIEDEEDITIEEDYTTLEAETIIIDDDSNIQTDAEYEQAVEQKELADEAREALSAVLLSVLEKGEINDDDIAEIAAQQEIYTENVTDLKILGLTIGDEKSTAGKSTTNVITSNIDYDELIKVLSEKADWLYIDEDGQVMLNGEVVPKLKVVELEAEKIKADVGEFKDLTTENFTAVNAKIDNLEVGDLTAVNADITNLKAQYAEIQTLVNGNLTSDNIQSIVITGDKFTVANGFIKDAMIETLSANKINTGIINTNNVSIQSEDGSMIINGTTQQFKDKNNKVRIQIGKDATGNFTFALFSQDGKGVLIDETGIKSGSVPDGLIVNDMVADNANISGGKLDISSVISSINNNENTLNSSKIKFDDTNQTLDIAFNQLKSKVETIENITVDGDLSSVIEQVQTNTTNISVMQGQISSLISNTTITKQDGTVTQLKDEFNSIKDTVTSHTQTINSHESTLTNVSAKQSEFQQDLNGFKQTVSNTYQTRGDMNNYATISELQQTSTDLTATFNNGYYQGVTQMNANGIKVYHNSIDSNSYTCMSPTGFYLKNKGKDILICDSNGLTYEGTITGSTISGSIFKSGTDYNPNKQNITGLQMKDDTIYSYGTKNNGMYAVTKIAGGAINIGNGADGAGLNWSSHVTSSDISMFKQGGTGYFYVGTTETPGSGYSTTTTTIDTTTINIGSRDETTAFKVDYNNRCEFGNNYFTKGTLTINQLSQGSVGGAQTYLSGTTISATTIYQNGSKVTGSDIILKDNIKKYEGNALDIVNKTNIYSFNRISDPNRTEIGFIAQQVPDELIYQRGKFTAEELEGLTPKEKTALLEQAQIEANKERDIAVYDKIAEEVVSFYDLDDKQTQNQIDEIQEEANNIEHTSPVSMLHENNIIGIMWKAIQELSKKVDELSK